MLLGVLPPREGETQVRFTGLADFQLVSPFFKSGELVSFNYNKLVGSSQKLHIDYTHPHILGTPFMVQGELDILKQDTTFLTRFFRFSGYYALTSTLSIKAYLKNRNSSLLSTEPYENDSVNVPPVLDGVDNTYGIGFLIDTRDNRLNPTRGMFVRADFGIGRKTIRKNPKLHENLYSGIELNLPKREADFQIGWFQQTLPRQVVYIGNRTYWLDQRAYFENDLLQVGGSKVLRGFNENQFFTSFFSMMTLEYRLILERNSYLFAFGDMAYMENAVEPQSIFRPFGTGIGMVYETKAGLVSITYAVGQVQDIPFQPARGRIHIGLVNQF